MTENFYFLNRSSICEKRILQNDDVSPPFRHSDGYGQSEMIKKHIWLLAILKKQYVM